MFGTFVSEAVTLTSSMQSSPAEIPKVANMRAVPPAELPPMTPAKENSGTSPSDYPPPGEIPDVPRDPISWADKARLGADRSLHCLAPSYLSAEGIPQVQVPDEVFLRGAEAHRDYVLSVFTGKLPSFSQIQSVLTHIWGRGVKLQIHLKPASRTMLVKIPNDFIRHKVVDQEIWHIGSSLFYVVQWSVEVALSPPTMTSIPLWAHVRGVPFDLYTREGLSLVAGLIGHPVEADEFTIKMVSLDVAHLKIRADCTKPLPDVVELVRQNGTIIPVSVTYPWVPPSCPCCNQLGHREGRCPNARWAPTNNQDAQAKDKVSPSVPAESQDPTFGSSSKGSSAATFGFPPKATQGKSCPTAHLASQRKSTSSTHAVELEGTSDSSSGRIIKTLSFSKEPALTSDTDHLKAKESTLAVSSTAITVFLAGSSMVASSHLDVQSFENPPFQKPSKKRKGSMITRRDSPETFPSKSELYPSGPLSTNNSFACLDSLRQDLAVSAVSKEGVSGISGNGFEGHLLSTDLHPPLSLPSQDNETSGFSLSSPTMGSSPPEERNHQ
ncbi:hypothetical protein Bca4012_007760 [Brassica carinata]